MTATPGNIIILNGASSAGKTSILKALQDILNPAYLDAGIDKFLWMLPGRYLNTSLWQDVFTYTWPAEGSSAGLTIQAGPLGHRLMSGMHRSIAALSHSGNHVIADHVLLEASWLVECANLFADLPALFVGVRCPLPVLEARERDRRDRTLGQAAAYDRAVHALASYDLEVDTSLLTPQECAKRIKTRLENGRAPTAFKRLRAMFAGTRPLP